MRPTLEPGTGLIGIRTPRARVGELRVFEHPDHADFWLVKRVVAASDGRMRVLSDDHIRPTVDSRKFGAVDVAGSYRVLLRVPASVDVSAVR